MLKKKIGLFLFLFLFLATTAYSKQRYSVLFLYKETHKPYKEALAGFKKSVKNQGVNVDIAYADFSESSVVNQIEDTSRFDAVVAMGTSSVNFAKKEYPNLPIVFTMVLNPIESGIVKSFQVPGGNTTGVMLNIRTLKKLRLLQDIFPDIRVVGMLYDSVKKKWQKEEVNRAVQIAELELNAVAVNTSAEIKKNLSIVLDQSDCLLSWVDPLVYNRNTIREIMVMTIKKKVPFIAFSSSYVKAGALIAFECDYFDVGQQTAELLAEVLRGEDAGKIPLYEPTKINISVNKRTAKLIGVKIKKKYLAKAKIFGGINMKIGLQTKFSIFSTLLVVIVSSILGFFLFRLQNQTMYNELAQHGKTVVRNLAQSAEYGILTGSREELERLASKTIKERDVSFCVIAENRGDILIKRQSRKDLAISRKFTKFDSVDETFKSEKVDMQCYDDNYVFTGVIKGVVEEEEIDETGLFAFEDISTGDSGSQREIVGIVRVGFSLVRLQRVMRKTLYTISAITFAIILIAALFTLLLIRMATVPILRLVDGTHKLSKGDLTVRITKTSGDEIGELAEAFNVMAEGLQKTRYDLIASNEYANSIVDNMLDCLFVVDAYGIIKSLNPASLSLLGHSYEELVGNQIANIFARRKDALDLITIIKEKQEIRSFEVEFLTKDGQEIPMSISASIMNVLVEHDTEIVEPEENKGGFVIAARDMRKMVDLINDINLGKEKLEEWSKTLESRVDERTRELLRSQESMLNIMTDLDASKAYIEIVVASLTDSLIVFTMEGNVRSANGVTHDMLGYPEDAFIGREFCDFIGDCEAFETLKKEGKIKNIETIFVTKEQVHIPILLSGAVMKDAKGDNIGVVVIAKDVTEQRRAEEELHKYIEQVEEVNQELDDFTYIVSHDLKEPLRSIDAFSRFIADDYGKFLDDDGMMYIDRVRSNAGRMQKLIEDLLEVSRLERSQNPFAPAEIKTLVEDAKQRLEYAIIEKKVEVVVGNDFPTISCDKHRLGEVFYNLMSNALKFLDKEKSVIEVGCVDKDEEFHFFIKDNGIGIEEKYFSKIFQIFQRLGKREQYEGTGAGLTIVKKIVEMHGGRIWVESKFGEGTSFIFSIPKVPLTK